MIPMILITHRISQILEPSLSKSYPHLIHSSLQQIFTECIYYTKFQVLFNLCLVPSSVKWSFVNQLDLTEMYKWDEYKNNVQNEM